MKFGFPSPDWRPHHSEAPNPNAPTRHMSSMVKRTLFEKNPENWWTLGSSGFWEPRKSCHTLAILGRYLTLLFHVHISCGFNSKVIQRFKIYQEMMLAASSPQIQAGQRTFKIGEATGKKKRDSFHAIPAAAYRYWAISSPIGKCSGLWMANSLDEQANESQRARSLALSC